VVLPFLLTGAILLFDRALRRMSRAVLPSAVAPRQVLLLATISILTHPILDTLNTYGVRWLMPFRGDWFYGDTLFIVDPWLWLALGVGVALSRRRSRGYAVVATRPARMALAVAVGYVAVMLLAGAAARAIARRELGALCGAPVERLMAGPEPVTPLVRSVVAQQGDVYRVGTFHWFRRPHLDAASLRAFPVPRPDDPMLRAAAATPVGRRFLTWARFPTVQVEPDRQGGSLVHLIDLRYTNRAGAGFGSVTVAVTAVSPAPTSSPAPDTTSPSAPAAPAARGR
jgi:inner membrane protein